MEKKWLANHSQTWFQVCVVVVLVLPIMCSGVSYIYIYIIWWSIAFWILYKVLFGPGSTLGVKSNINSSGTTRAFSVHRWEKLISVHSRRITAFNTSNNSMERTRNEFKIFSNRTPPNMAFTQIRSHNCTCEVQKCAIKECAIFDPNTIWVVQINLVSACVCDLRMYSD